MTVHLAWGITGAGHLLEESFRVMDYVVHSHQARVTTFLSSVAVQVVKMYGFWDQLQRISPGPVEVSTRGHRSLSPPTDKIRNPL